MLKRLEYVALLALAALIVVLVVTNIVLVLGNRSAQAEIQRDAQFIQQTAQLEVLYREIVKALADLSVKNQDAELRGLLTSHGITVTVNPPGGSAPAPAPAEPARKGAQK
jgi:hypothetical protein